MLKHAQIQNTESKERAGHSAQIRDSGLYLSTLLLMKKADFAKAIKQLSLMATKIQSNRDVLMLKAKLNIFLGQSEKPMTYTKKSGINFREIVLLPMIMYIF